VLVGDAVTRLGARFAAAAVPEPELSSRYLVSQVLGGWRANDYAAFAGESLSAAQQAELERLVHCRLARMPLQYIAGHWDFRRIRLTTRPPVFIPRHNNNTEFKSKHCLPVP
jgi:release factor glutamine methyltransferase